MQKIVFIALGYAETRFRLLGEDLSEYSSSKSIYKGRGFHQLTGIQDSSGLYNEAGPYEKYADFVGNKNIISQPDLLCTQIHYAIDSAGWFWTDKTNGKSVPNWSSASNTEYIKFRAEYFSKALGKQLNEVSHLVEEDEKYFWLQAKMLNGYPKGQKLETNPNGWATRKKAFDILKNEVFEFDKRCKGNEKLEFTGDRAPWMEIAVRIAKEMKGCTEERNPMYSNAKKYLRYCGNKFEPTDGENGPWCAAFMNWTIGQTINPITNEPYSHAKSASSLAPIDAALGKKYKKISTPIYGCLVVYKHVNPKKWKGHTGFLYGKTKNEKYILLGGNQDNTIRFDSYGEYTSNNKTKKLYGFYIPKDYEITDNDKLTDNDIYENANSINIKLGIITGKSKGQTN
ncbi:C40 family peptidase [Apibacter adventoris]|uniref:hypothetical protein n=1 Tax=Apibacter adventoris TaxID=1679466 RepID=UPI000CF68FCE|nr:hypothetical protein [Apibacter adventoris]PQL95926.1 hypothetical protein C4S76_00040 [Apibacter adventoris]